MDLQSKLILLQYDAVFKVYAKYITAEDHVKLIPVDKHITFSGSGNPRSPSYLFVVNWNGMKVGFDTTDRGMGEFNSFLSLGGRTASCGELSDLLGMVTYEMFYQLKLYAERTDQPSENLVTPTMLWHT